MLTDKTSLPITPSCKLTFVARLLQHWCHWMSIIRYWFVITSTKNRCDYRAQENCRQKNAYTHKSISNEIKSNCWWIEEVQLSYWVSRVRLSGRLSVCHTPMSLLCQTPNPVIEVVPPFGRQYSSFRELNAIAKFPGITLSGGVNPLTPTITIRLRLKSGLSVRVYLHVKNYKWRLNPVWHRMLLYSSKG